VDALTAVHPLLPVPAVYAPIPVGGSPLHTYKDSMPHIAPENDLVENLSITGLGSVYLL
jgi:hypothetical protein